MLVIVSALMAGPGAAGPAAGPLGGPMLGGHGLIVGAGAPKPPDIAASAWIVADAGTGEVLAAKDPHGEYRPASTLKVLTAVALIPALNPSSTVVATQLAASQYPNDIGLQAGQSYRVSDLFTALLTISANDAAVALAQATGSYARGLSIINAEARHLQADDTYAGDPNGLDAPGQRISVYDLALIGRQALQIPAFMKYDTVTGGLFPVKPHKSVGLWNQNALLTRYRGGVGGKIGWTSLAGATYVGMARRGGTTLIVAELHCPALTEITSAEKLLNWGFAQDGKVSAVGTLVAPLPGAPPGASASASASSPAMASGRAGGQAARAEAARGETASRSGLGNGPVLAAGLALVVLVAAGAAIALLRRRRRVASELQGFGDCRPAGELGLGDTQRTQGPGRRPPGSECDTRSVDVNELDASPRL
jgi:serine-type D-Ala-D-Ala carboxypeptidase (penicillin-binding protein 5/6)